MKHAHLHRGIVVWITGLSGAGKSTIAKRCAELLLEAGELPTILDGDEFRKAVGDDLGHDHAGRLLNAYRLARFANMLARQGHTVLCATMSLFHEVQEWNREHNARYLEVYVRAPIESLEARDAKGIYGRVRRGESSGLVGVDLPFHEPLRPDLVFDNDKDLASMLAHADRIIDEAARIRSAAK